MSLNENTAYVLSLADDKCDPKLGSKVCEHLRGLGLIPRVEHTRAITHGVRYDPKNAVQSIMGGIQLGLSYLGLDVTGDPSLHDTPKRYAKMLVGELTKGLNFDFFPKCTTFPNGERVLDAEATADFRTGLRPEQMTEYTEIQKTIGAYDQMVFLGKIQTISLCEHHLQTIYGETHIAYLPADRAIGLSKLARVTDFFARRPQVQERMTEQIYHALSYVLSTDDVAVVQSCAHYCMRARGALQHSSVMKTNKMGGKFMTNPALRQEFLDACHNPNS